MMAARFAGRAPSASDGAAGPVIEGFRPFVRNSLRGFASARFRSGLVLHEITLHESNGKAWASPPARRVVDQTGAPIIDPVTGKARWQPLITFSSKAVRDRWSEQVVAAVRAAHPRAFDGEAVS